jgi:hypothetical protein
VHESSVFRADEIARSKDAQPSKKQRPDTAAASTVWKAGIGYGTRQDANEVWDAKKAALVQVDFTFIFQH